MYRSVSEHLLMDGPAIGLVAFACLFSATVAGVLVHARLPRAELSLQGQTVIRRGVGLVAVMAALLLVLLTVYLKTHFDGAVRDVRHFSAELGDLDHALRQAGPD